MRPRNDDGGASWSQVSGFGSGRAALIARVLVVEMVLWPGLLFLGGTLFVAWQARGSLPALAALALATVVSALVGVRQWGVMLRAVFAGPASSSAASARVAGDSGEGSPRLTSRGGTR